MISHTGKDLHFRTKEAKVKRPKCFLLDSSPVHVCFTPNTSWLKNAEKGV